VEKRQQRLRWEASSRMFNKMEYNSRIGSVILVACNKQMTLLYTRAKKSEAYLESMKIV
jgi:hypothetical protein